jgi:hypothetical protein
MSMPRSKEERMLIKMLLRELKGYWFKWSRYQLPKEHAHNRLKRLTGQDFGYDVKAWRRWFDENPDVELRDG